MARVVNVAKQQPQERALSLGSAAVRGVEIAYRRQYLHVRPPA